MSRRRSRRSSRRSPGSSASAAIDFVRRWKKVLRLPLNAAEARLLNGHEKDPDPGLVKHLVAKVDRQAIEAALKRRPLSDDAAQRARFLAGASGLTGDPGVLLDALDAQRAVATRADVAKAFAEAMRQLDLSRLSTARMARLLRLIDEIFAPAQRLATAFALLRNRKFRRVLDEATEDRLDPEVARRWLPLAAVYEALDDRDPPPDRLEAGLRLLLEAPPEVLDAQPKRVRFGLVDLALTLDASWPLESDAIGHVVDSLDPEDMAWAGLAFTRAAGQVRLGHYDTAAAQLDAVLEHHPADLRAKVLRQQLAAPRLGPIALPDPSPGGLRAGYALSLLKPVRVRTDADATSLALHRQLAVPGVALPLVADSDSAAPWFAVDGALPLLSDVLGSLDRAGALQVAAAGARIAALLARLDLTLPDLGPERFLTDASPTRRWLLLADTTGLKEQPVVARAHMRTIAARFARAALADPPFSDGPTRADLRRTVAKRLERQLSEPPPTEELCAWLEGL